MLRPELCETQDPILQEDLENIVQNMDLSALKKSTVFITGATGLIGSQVAKALLCYNRLKHEEIHLLLLARTPEKALKCFGALLQRSDLSIVYGDIEQLNTLPISPDYIIHTAAVTASKQFVEHPVCTISVTLNGTQKILELCRKYLIKGMAFLSSMEIYGYPQKGVKIEESEVGKLSPLNVRNSYPLSKVMAETMCIAYEKEWGVPVKIARLTQSFGPSVDYGDNRIFAEFARCVIEKRPIVLKTKGETERSYLYTADAVSGILTVLLKGIAGKAYNLANEKTYCSIREMAELVAKQGGISVQYQPMDVAMLGYADTLYMDLSTKAAQALGWQPKVLLPEMYQRMITSMRFNLEGMELKKCFESDWHT